MLHISPWHLHKEHREAELGLPPRPGRALRRGTESAAGAQGSSARERGRRPAARACGLAPLPAQRPRALAAPRAAPLSTWPSPRRRPAASFSRAGSAPSPLVRARGYSPPRRARDPRRGAAQSSVGGGAWREPRPVPDQLTGGGGLPLHRAAAGGAVSREPRLWPRCGRRLRR